MPIFTSCQIKYIFPFSVGTFNTDSFPCDVKVWEPAGKLNLKKELAPVEPGNEAEISLRSP